MPLTKLKYQKRMQFLQGAHSSRPT